MLKKLNQDLKILKNQLREVKIDLELQKYMLNRLKKTYILEELPEYKGEMNKRLHWINIKENLIIQMRNIQNYKKSLKQKCIIKN